MYCIPGQHVAAVPRLEYLNLLLYSWSMCVLGENRSSLQPVCLSCDVPHRPPPNHLLLRHAWSNYLTKATS